MEGNTMCERRHCRRYFHHHQQHHHHVSSSLSSSRNGRYRWWWWWWCWRVMVVYFVLLSSCGEANPSGANSEGENMYSKPLEGVAKIQVLVCFTDVNDQDIMSVKIFDPRNDTTSLVFVNMRSKQCLASATFSSCEIGTPHGQIILKAIIIDLEEGETRTYACEVLRLTASGKTDPNVYHANVTYTGPTTTTTIISTTSESSTMRAGSSLESTNSATAGFQMPNSVVFVVLGLLVFFITLCCVLGIHYYRGRRRKRKSRDCDAMSVRSGVTDKDFYTVAFNPNGGTGDLGLRGPPPPRGGGFVRQFSISSASGMPNTSAPNNVEMPGSLAQRLVMQYQKPSDTVIVPAEVSTLNFSDRGYVSGSSVHYQEPWGRTLDDPEILGKLSTLRSPNRHLVRIPDFHTSASASASASASTSTPTTTTTTADTTPSSPFPSAPPPPLPPSGDSPPPPSPPSLSLPPTQESEPPFPAAPSCPSPSPPSSSSPSSSLPFPPPECHA